MSLYDTIWEWKKELVDNKGKIYLHLKGEEKIIKINNEDHISCIDDIIFVYYKGGCFFKREYGIPIESINYITLEKEVEE